MVHDCEWEGEHSLYNGLEKNKNSKPLTKEKIEEFLSHYAAPKFEGFFGKIKSLFWAFTH